MTEEPVRIVRSHTGAAAREPFASIDSWLMRSFEADIEISDGRSTIEIPAVPHVWLLLRIVEAAGLSFLHEGRPANICFPEDEREVEVAWGEDGVEIRLVVPPARPVSLSFAALRTIYRQAVATMAFDAGAAFKRGQLALWSPWYLPG
jgi:hypothetical protein